MSTERAGDAGSGLRLRNWRVRSRLVALILVPTAAAVLLGGIQVIASMNAAADYQRVNDLARLSDDIGALTHELAEERDRTAWFIALGRPERGLKGINDQRDAVDTAAERVREGGALLRGELTGRTGDEVEAALTRLDDLTPLRRQALETNLLPDAAVDAYTLVVEDLLSLHDELGKGSDDDLLFGQALTLTALARAKESLSQQRALLSVVLVAGRFEQDQMEKFLGALSSERNGRKSFAAEAGTADRRFFDETVNGRSADRADFLRELVLLRAASGAPLKGLDQAESDDARQWFDAVSVTIDRTRAVEQRHAQGIVARSGALGDAEQNRALLVIGAVAALLLAVLLITTGVARSLVRPLRRLRTEALEVAGERLPSYVQRVRETRDGEFEVDVPPIGIVSRDEIGEVARAFDEVHREAVRLAGDEAKLRNTVNAMFVNLSRRSQTLVERQLSLVERLERGERDDNRLADLFKLDHLATRMRRNSENLLVLAGQEVARRWRQPVEVMDIVRAALSEVENYDRVVTRIHSEVAVAGPAVSDVVHLLAELVENAVAFSPGETKVVVSSSRIDGGGVMIGVSDQGIGMTLEELTQANARLAGPQAADAAAARRMGLFVVGRLAFKHGIRVQLRPQETGGLTAMVLLPESLIATLPGHSFPPGPQSPFAGADPSFAGAQSSFAGAEPSFAGAQSPFGSTDPPFPPGAQPPFPGADPSFAGGQPAVFGTPTPPFPGGPGPSRERGAFADTPPFQRAADGTGPTPPAGMPAFPPLSTGSAGAFPPGPAGPPFPPPPAAPSFPPGAPASASPAGAVPPQGRPPGATGPSVWNSPERSGPPGNPPFVPPGPIPPGPIPPGPVSPGPFDRFALNSTDGPGSLERFAVNPAEETGPFDRFTKRSVEEPAPVDSLPTPGEPAVSGALPTVETSALDTEDEYLPIFASVESGWFRTIDRTKAATQEPSGDGAPDEVSSPAPEQWASPADSGWQAAQAASEPVYGAVTSSGLPRRTPKANLVPGSVTPANPAEPSSPSPPQPPPATPVSPERVRSRMASFQQGVRRARNELPNRES
ncbi:sensor histidine kinase [Planobispora takensis]|uniref:histidine kinase n=1 Tax=Planobispora takensis TaxID=1367882 RepID=A0A8J3SYN3_9ACTN|nr:nitrate- and nitrite sensing domain-containing protein [Planobispora takensis]GII01143.1 hypothetical protein Pta02_31510 [Planobispora takensis]